MKKKTITKDIGSLQVDFTGHMREESTSIGYAGTNQFDHGVTYTVCDSITWNMNEYSLEQNDIIRRYWVHNWEIIAAELEEMCERGLV